MAAEDLSLAIRNLVRHDGRAARVLTHVVVTPEEIFYAVLR